MANSIDYFGGDIRGVIDRYLAETEVAGADEQAVLAGELEDIAAELRDDEYESRSGVPYRHLDPDDAHGRFGGEDHYRLIQMAFHRIINRYYEKNARIVVENESLSFQSGVGGRMGYNHGTHSEKELHPDIFVEMEPGEAGMNTEKTIIVECETSKYNLLDNDLRMAAYNLLRKGNTDRNALMLYVAFPESLKGEVETPEWANDCWFFEL